MISYVIVVAFSFMERRRQILYARLVFSIYIICSIAADIITEAEPVMFAYAVILLLLVNLFEPFICFIRKRIRQLFSLVGRACQKLLFPLQKGNIQVLHGKLRDEG